MRSLAQRTAKPLLPGKNAAQRTIRKTPTGTFQTTLCFTPKPRNTHGIGHLTRGALKK